MLYDISKVEINVLKRQTLYNTSKVEINKHRDLLSREPENNKRDIQASLQEKRENRTLELPSQRCNLIIIFTLS